MAAQQGRGHCCETAIKKSDNGLQLHMGIKMVLFGEMSSGLIETKIEMFGLNEEKRGGLQAEEHHSNCVGGSTGVVASCCVGALLQDGLVHFTK